MKWFFTITEEFLGSYGDHGCATSIRAAVKSARERTHLVPHMIFDGEECDFTREMREEGVNVIFHHLHYYERLKRAQRKHLSHLPDYMQKAAGTFLALEIALLEREDQYILYTECDIFFLREPRLEFCKPEIFAACGQSDPHGYFTDMNAGVMVMNLHRIRNDLPSLIDFLCDNLGYINGHLQELLRIFYNGKWSPLSARFNWKPYWGVNDEVVIVHFHGCKPLAARHILEDATYREEEPSFQPWRSCFFRNPAAYAHYVGIWEEGLHEHAEFSPSVLVALFDAHRDS